MDSLVYRVQTLSKALLGFGTFLKFFLANSVGFSKTWT